MFLILDPFVEIGLAIVSEKVSIATSGWSDTSYTFTLLSQRAPGCRIHRFWDLLVHTNSSLRGPTFPLGLSGHEIRGLQQRSVGRELAEGYVVVSSWPWKISRKISRKFWLRVFGPLENFPENLPKSIFGLFLLKACPNLHRPFPLAYGGPCGEFALEAERQTRTCCGTRA